MARQGAHNLQTLVRNQPRILTLNPMEKLIEKQQESIELLKQSYTDLINDLKAGQLAPEELVEKHTIGFEETMERVESLVEPPEAELIIEIDEEGELMAVHSRRVTMDYIVKDRRYVFDPYDVRETETFSVMSEVIDREVETL